MTAKRRISFEQDQALAAGRVIARRNQRQQVAARQAREARDAANESRVEFIPPRNQDRFMAIWKVRVVGADGGLRASREFYSEVEARSFAEQNPTKHGMSVFNWDTNEFEAVA